jgi:probable F420-dependent oxidoreductase
MKFWQSMAFLEVENLTAIAEVADTHGYEGIAVSDHLFFPEVLDSHYPVSPDGKPFWFPDTPWPDPWVAIGAMAAVTKRLRFTTNVYVAPARDVMTMAKLVSTAAVISGNRVALGVAPGWCAEEFAATGQDFRTRGKRLDEMVPALRELWKGGMRQFSGTYVNFPAVQLAPVPSAPVPIYFGGESEAALRRAARLGDGWIGVEYDDEGAEAIIGRLRRHLAEAGRAGEPFEIILAMRGEPDVEMYKRWTDRGVTGFQVAPWMIADSAYNPHTATLEQRLERSRWFADTIIDKI